MHLSRKLRILWATASLWLIWPASIFCYAKSAAEARAAVCSELVGTLNLGGAESAGDSSRGKPSFRNALWTFLDIFERELQKQSADREVLGELLENPRTGRLKEASSDHRQLNEILRLIRNQITERASDLESEFAAELARRVSKVLEAQDQRAQESRRVIEDQRAPYRAHQINVGSPIMSLALVESEGALLVGTWRGEILVFDLDGYRLHDRVPAGTEGIRSIALDPQHLFMLAGANEGWVRKFKFVWNKHRFLDRSPVRLRWIEDLRSLVLSPKGDVFAISGGGSHSPILSWMEEDQKAPIPQPPPSNSQGYSVIFDHAGDSVFFEYMDGNILRWNFRATKSSERVVREYPGAIATIHDLKLSPDGEFLAAGTAEGFVRVWDVKDPSNHFVIPVAGGRAHDVELIDFIRDGRTLVSLNEYGHIQFWDFRDQREIYRLTTERELFRKMLISSDAKRLFTGGRSGVLSIHRLPCELWNIP